MEMGYKWGRVSIRFTVENPTRLGYSKSMSKMKSTKLNETIKKYLSKLGVEGGKVKSLKKAKAAKENGKKGGRPKGTK